MTTPPQFGAHWRSLEQHDLPALRGLAQACFDADGGLPLAITEPFLASRYLVGTSGTTIAAFDSTGAILAASAVRVSGDEGKRAATIVGMVDPAARRQGIGSWLLDWGLEQARMLADLPEFTLSSESVGETAEKLYAARGFVNTFTEHTMRRDLTQPLPHMPLPAGIEVLPWSHEHITDFFTAYSESFRERPGFPNWSAEEWVEWISDDEDFRPDLTLLALEGATPLAFLAGSNGWITQVGTVPAARGRGLGSALIGRVLEQMRAEGTTEALLTVNTNNPGAIRLYGQLGFVDLGRRARYSATNTRL